MESYVYPVCLAVGLLFAIISALAGQFFDGHDGTDIGTGGHAEAGFDDAGLPGISLFSPTVLASFVTAFGAFGMIFSRIGTTSSPWISAPLSIVCGAIIAAAVMTLFNQMFKRTQSSSESHVASLVGMEASIITPIPENGVGEIAYVQSSTRYSAPARTETGKSIAAGQAVRITRIVGSQFYVEPLH